MAMSAVAAGGGVKAEPNVTPMIDVMLVLLIIFMVVMPAITPGFKADPPQGMNLKPHPEEDSDQVLGIDADGQYYLNKKPIANEDARGRDSSRSTTNRDEDKILYVKATRTCEYEQGRSTRLDIAAKNGVRVVGADHASSSRARFRSSPSDQCSRRAAPARRATNGNVSGTAAAA